MNPDLLPEVLRAREKENIRKRNSSTSLPSTSTLSPVPINNPDLSDSINVLEDTALDDEEGDLPPAPEPSLVMRLFQNSNESSRDLLCNFLGSSLIPGKRSAAPRGRGKRARNA